MADRYIGECIGGPDHELVRSSPGPAYQVRIMPEAFFEFSSLTKIMEEPMTAQFKTYRYQMHSDRKSYWIFEDVPNEDALAYLRVCKSYEDHTR